ncbi:MAG: hypothetical protein NTZ02_00340 [Candidatus Woesearchaeota archaeon]|nr:hypothetical protein [Candidatus Woesearchaeota archaeon]
MKSEGKPGTGEQLEGMQEKQKSEKTKKSENCEKSRFFKKKLGGRKNRKRKPLRHKEMLRISYAKNTCGIFKHKDNVLG